MKAYVPALALLVSLQSSAAVVDDPWSLVPALPTACHGNQDDFSENVDVVLATLDEEISAQQAKNDEVSSQVGDMAAADPFAMAQRMQQYMLDNPEEATKMMESLYSTGQTVYEDTTAETERERGLTVPLDDLIARYRRAYADMRAPIDARIEALPWQEGKGGGYLASEGIAELPAISREASQAYERLCAEWWQPGPFPAPLRQFRAFLADEKAPREQQLFDQGKQQWTIQGADTSEVRSTAAMDATRSYLKQLQRIYAERREAPFNIHVIPGGLVRE